LRQNPELTATAMNASTRESLLFTLSVATALALLLALSLSIHAF
jgi:hypothetical protein